MRYVNGTNIYALDEYTMVCSQLQCPCDVCKNQERGERSEEERKRIEEMTIIIIY